MRKRLLILLLASVLFAMPAFSACKQLPSSSETEKPEQGTSFESETDPSLESETEEETEEETESQPAVTEPYKYVVVIGVDGAGTSFKETDTPNFDRIFHDGAVTYASQSMIPSNGAENWGSMLHGVLPEIHGLNNSVTGVRGYPENSRFPSVFRLAHEQMPDAQMASFCTWKNLNYGIIENGLGVYRETVDNGTGLTEKVCRYVKENQPTLLLVQTDEVDKAGHASGFMSDAFVAQLKKADELIGAVYDAYRDAGLLDDTLFVVASDHGGVNNGHGGTSSKEAAVMFAAAGRTVRKGTVGVMDNRDVAAVVAYALDLAVPDTWTARVPARLFEGVPESDRPVFERSDGRAHDVVSTPSKTESGYVSHYLGGLEPSLYLAFDGEVKDEYQTSVKTVGTVEFIDGYFGQAASLNSGYVQIPDYSVGTDSFSIALWLKTGGEGSDPSIVSNKDWNFGGNSGYILSLRSGDIKFNAGSEGNRMDAEYALPFDYKDNWIHLVLSVDRQAEVIRFCYDFGAFYEHPLPDALKGVSLDAYPSLMIGQDGTGTYAPLHAAVDEFMLFDCALTMEDVRALENYYKQTPLS
ncbi:MAG: alkaline phosphatase family protein [Clostridia bacterium]|nr:alkaline phosphatase family protein [Clostridia bacterium]